MGSHIFCSTSFFHCPFLFKGVFEFTFSFKQYLFVIGSFAILQWPIKWSHYTHTNMIGSSIQFPSSLRHPPPIISLKKDIPSITSLTAVPLLYHFCYLSRTTRLVIHCHPLILISTHTFIDPLHPFCPFTIAIHPALLHYACLSSPSTTPALFHLLI